jgi:D-alanyl-lipoteichoic acid acyltransferase DltB (MBOAT superfamily)
VDNETVSKAFTLLLIGLVRKVVVADPLLAAVPLKVFQDPGMYTAAQLALMTVLFGVGLYFDFSGYTDIVRGISGLFGIELSPNFRWPLFSRSFSDFWNRWHITLSHWLRDNIFYPLTRRYLKKNSRPDHWKAVLIPPLLTMLFSGFWHGTATHFLAWGMLMGLLLALERLWRLKVNPAERMVSGNLRHAGSTVFTVGLMFLCSIPFMVPLENIPSYMKVISQLAGSNAADFRILIFLVPGLLIDLVQFRANDELVFMRWPSSVLTVAIGFSLFAVFFMSQVYVPGVFLYQGF